ncbi:hypothetical protein HanRHA438_Chr07g0301411 [Helianthus annuus]|nr:hypothetical protein HanRHA438_Chr07g0301411 [Helianthus annuus]
MQAAYIMNCGKDNVAHCGGSGGGCGRGGGDGGGRGLHGGKIKKVVSRRIGSDVTNVVDLNLRRGESDVTNVASGKGRSKKSDPKNPNKKTHVDKSSVWTHGPYVVIRSLEGKTMAYRRFGAGGCSQVDEGDQMADVAGMSDNIAPITVMVTMEMVVTMVTMVEIVMVALATSVDGGGDDGGNDGGDGTVVRATVVMVTATKYRWNRGDDQLIYDTFINVLKRRFRDIMINLRQKSKKKATDKGHKIRAGKYNFNVQRRFPPDGIPLEKWERMCSEKNEGKKVGYRKVFFQTHATKECKKRVQDGEIDENDFENLDFVTKHAKNSYVSYHSLFVYSY